ncbi:hypothetical protein QCE49_14980 [Caballeronia sp. LZ008]|uniref:hypothetical protein n=1 Tax=unclassified Caballeronia TaxID=2646786 RepID=UPI002028934C|nr:MULTISPECIES: hypothetical protein [unclassified Caballeronia]MDR5794678.1 hypothetical protein [Caballeronia sp. LZ008]
MTRRHDPIPDIDHRDESMNQPENNAANAEDEREKDRAAREALDRGDKEKIDKKLDELDVSRTESGKDQSSKPDTEGSNSSSKNLDEQSD